MRLLPVTVLAFLAAPAWAQLQDSWVVPAAFANTNASATNNFPFTYTGYVRLQQAIDPATMGVPRNIQGMAFRPRTWATQQQQPFTRKMSIKLSLSAKPVNQLDGVYANNVKGTQVEVWNGPVYFHTPTANTPNEFATTIWFQKSFLYVGTDPILIDMVPLDPCAGGGDGRGTDFDPTSTGMGCVLGKGDHTNCTPPTSGGFQQQGGYVIKFFGSALMPYGLGCKGSNGVPAISSTGGAPGRGNAGFALVLGQGKASSAAALVLGFNRDQPIFPASLGSGMPGCWLWTEILLLGTAPTDATGGAQVGLPIPNDPGLADKAFYVQWFVVDAAANPAGLSTSPGGAVVVR